MGKGGSLEAWVADQSYTVVLANADINIKPAAIVSLPNPDLGRCCWSTWLHLTNSTFAFEILCDGRRLLHESTRH